MDARGKVRSGFRKILKTVHTIGRRSSSYEKGYRKLLDAESDIPMEEAKMSNNNNPGGLQTHGSGVPKGHLPVYVGPERKLFVIKVEYLEHDLFRALLDVSRKAYGNDSVGGLTLECEPSVFEDLLRGIHNQCQAPKKPTFK